MIVVLFRLLFELCWCLFIETECLENTVIWLNLIKECRYSEVNKIISVLRFRVVYKVSGRQAPSHSRTSSSQHDDYDR